ncbi:hypothetical protein INR49_015065 [Caranx melampygus]|nr:hypothetical protein INR49_015065 [Caranx melampygus]
MKEVKRVKAGGAKKQLLSLREAQAVLMRKTLSQGGRGDKMATLLMNHIEKERRKLRAVISSFSSSSNSSSSSTSSSASSSVKSFHTQKGQYTIHITAPTGQ